MLRFVAPGADPDDHAAGERAAIQQLTETGFSVPEVAEAVFLVSVFGGELAALQEGVTPAQLDAARAHSAAEKQALQRCYGMRAIPPNAGLQYYAQE